MRLLLYITSQLAQRATPIKTLLTTSSASVTHSATETDTLINVTVTSQHIIASHVTRLQYSANNSTSVT